MHEQMYVEVLTPRHPRSRYPLVLIHGAAQTATNWLSRWVCTHAAASLLDRIGPAIILTHSQSGPFGWLIADARPKLVKAVVAVEPAGPPFQNTLLGTEKARAWGVADIPITYDPPVPER
jgi:pimeloyl-ACP methyl ester carboxylesterase